MNDEIQVSVFCTVYNHEKYLRQCLNGFVIQKTNFRFEVLVHDDASTDHSADIIREYAEKYPEIIKPIYQTENQYSQHIGIAKTFLLPRAKGKYIALCEGDDYWIDADKLQKQYDYMEENPTCTLCFTNGECRKNGEFVKYHVPYAEWNLKYFDPEKENYDLGEMAVLDFVPTASLFYPRTVAEKNLRIEEEGIYRGDTFTRLYSTFQGYAHFIKEVTCVYNQSVDGSITDGWRKDNKKRAKAFCGLVNLIDYMDKNSKNEYHEKLFFVKYKFMWTYCSAISDFSGMRGGEYFKQACKDGIKPFLRYVIATRFLWAYTVYQKFKGNC